MVIVSNLMAINGLISCEMSTGRATDDTDMLLVELYVDLYPWFPSISAPTPHPSMPPVSDVTLTSERMNTYTRLHNYDIQACMQTPFGK